MGMKTRGVWAGLVVAAAVCFGGVGTGCALFGAGGGSYTVNMRSEYAHAQAGFNTTLSALIALRDAGKIDAAEYARDIDPWVQEAGRYLDDWDLASKSGDVQGVELARTLLARVMETLLRAEGRAQGRETQ
jgi:hypothetical protein